MKTRTATAAFATTIIGSALTQATNQTAQVTEQAANVASLNFATLTQYVSSINFTSYLAEFSKHIPGSLISINDETIKATVSYLYNEATNPDNYYKVGGTLLSGAKDQAPELKKLLLQRS